MGLDMGVLSMIDYSFIIHQEAKAFVAFLMKESSNVACSDESHALGFWTKDQMTADLRAYLKDRGSDSIEEKAVLGWLASLPWENDYIRLYFNS